ncbi:MAG: hypothetical protein GXP63_00485 [DPANN group archaeon]|nr:hypothetical protein [DPANN group archaeon]
MSDVSSENNRLDKELVLRAFITLLQDDYHALEDEIGNIINRVRDAEGPNVSRHSTHKIEGSWEANEQSRRLYDLGKDISEIEQYTHKASCNVVDVGALIQYELDHQSGHFLMMPAQGGEIIPIEDYLVRVLTPMSPIGQQFMQKKEGDTVVFNNNTYTIQSIS